MFTMSMQQSPIDLAMSRDDFNISSEEDIGCPVPMASDEETPVTPPIETPLLPGEPKHTSNPRIWAIRNWEHHLPYNGEMFGFEKAQEGVAVYRLGERQFDVLKNGLQIDFYLSSSKKSLLFAEWRQWPNHLMNMYCGAQVELEKWRSRVVSLSMETDDLECSLMDDLLPPRTFLVEYKRSAILKSMKVQAGVLHIKTVARTVSIPSSCLAQHEHETIADVVKPIAPETSNIELNKLYDDFVKLRGIVLTENRRLVAERISRGNPELSTIDITVGGM